MTDALLKEYVQMSALKKSIEEELESVKVRLAEIEPQLLDEFAEAGMQSANIDGHTIYIQRQLWAKVEDGASKDDVILGLKAAGYSDYVNETYNTQQVSALLREWDKQELPIPAPLEGKLGSTEKFSLRVRKA